MKAYVFPGQGSQFPGMGQDLYQHSEQARTLFAMANDQLGFCITDVMFSGTPAALQATAIAQPALFLHAVIAAAVTPDFAPELVAGHSVGEIAALVASQVLSFTQGLQVVVARATAMQAACQHTPGAMAAVLGLTEEQITQVCTTITATRAEVVVPANYNSPSQLVISGTHQGVALAQQAFEQMGAKKVIPLPVGGGFHSPLMESAIAPFAQAIAAIAFQPALCPVYQNVTALPHQDPTVIKAQVQQQLTAPVKWTQTIQQMVQDGATHFVTCGPGTVLQGLIKRIAPGIPVTVMPGYVYNPPST